MSDVTRRATAVPRWRSYGLRQWLGVAAAALFWGWLVFRWVNDWLLGGAVVPPGQPLIPAAAFAGVAESLSAAADALGLLGWPLAQVAGLFSFLATGAPALPALAQGAWLTVVLTVTSIALGFVLAVPLAVTRVYGEKTAWLSLAYTELIRGTPLLAQLFVLYYGMGLSAWIRELPLVGVGFVPNQAVWVAIIGFTINGSAYQSEYIRAAIESVDSGQLTAARAVGMSKLAGIRHVVLPQGLRYAIPGWSNELVYLIKYSSLAAFITVPELFERADAVASETFEFTTMYAFAALLYLGLVLSASKLMSVVERRFAIPGIGTVEGRDQ
ncbi:amino acid ABC transporter permease [Halorussus gelatinilyticus]|uniref:Amino acid ABC transporter permease n=1 Tax=Halorussus gelatinilyticus TaxID=2937524 RepID=A0A8U0IIC7_9EURY|nr:amino acid ABC transporter permease [Halorussus gelatinilyticus]UPW00847.1 amino acid ABC transporter permease [Halorussus gelatinilyticus]